MNRAPKSTEAFDELIAALQEIRDGYVLDDQRFTDDLDVVEGFRYVTEVLSGASEFFMEADPDHPRMASIVTPARKLQGDNPDSIYHFARIDGGRSYRVYGVRSEEAYISFTVHSAAVDGGFNGRVLADINDSQFTFAPDGSYEIVFSAEPHDGNWVKLDPDARMIIVRSYFLRERSAQNDPTVAVRIGIECLDDVPPPPPLDDATFAGRLRDGVAFLRQMHRRATVARHAVAGAVHGERTQPRRPTVELPQRGRRGRRCRRHLLLHGPLGPRPRRRAGHAGHDPAVALHQRDAVEPAHADLGVRAPPELAQQRADLV